MHLGEEVGVGLLGTRLEVIPHFLEHGFTKVLVGGTVLLADGEKEVFFESALLNREGLEAVGEGRRTQFFLPLREVGTLDGGHGVLLLPFGQVVGVGRGVETQHLSLQGENVFGHKWSLEIYLRDDVVCGECGSLVNISASQLGADQELLALAKSRDSVGVLGLLGGVNGQVEARLRAREGRRVQGNDELDVASLS